MANEGSRAYYLILDKLKDQLIADENVNSVTTGDLTEIDLEKQSMYPISHIIVNNSTFADNVINFSITVIAMDLVDQSKDEKTDKFRGNDNEADVLNTQLLVQNRLYQELKRGTLYSDAYQLIDAPSCEPFTDRFENQVSGWAMTFTLSTRNNVQRPSCD
tara:strand:+ start:145 stop:624 length:480 start_codon:yes stop_codon:yes gene_type:complete